MSRCQAHAGYAGQSPKRCDARATGESLYCRPHFDEILAGIWAKAERNNRPGQTLILEDFPRPDIARALSPNGRAHWTTKRTARLVVFDKVTVYALRAQLQRMHGLVVIRPRFVYPIKRTRDDDNLATGVMKAVRDCLVQGRWLEADDTDHVQQMPVEVCVQRGRRALELTFEVADDTAA